MQPQKPGTATDNLQQHTSVAKVLAGNMTFGDPVAFDVNNIPTTYKQDNLSGNMFRQMFVSINTDTVINHNLGRVPIGYIVTRKNHACDVFDGTIAGWTESQIVLQCSVAASDVTIYIF